MLRNVFEVFMILPIGSGHFLVNGFEVASVAVFFLFCPVTMTIDRSKVFHRSIECQGPTIDPWFSYDRSIVRVPTIDRWFTFDRSMVVMQK